jgi:site-specific DNA-methyltransferase (adenine-specific)
LLHIERKRVRGNRTNHPRKYDRNAEKQAAYRARQDAGKRAAVLEQIPKAHGEGYDLYQGDAAVILPLLRGLDVLITDPPYGVLRAQGAQGRASRGTGGKHGLVRGAYATYDDSYANFVGTVVPILNACLDRVQRGAVFSGPHVEAQRPAAVIGGVYSPAGAGRHPWGFKTFHPVLFYGTHPTLERGARGSTTLQSSHTAEKNGHPCPKPIEWMRWLVALTSLPGETVIDPFMGSGTTGVAALEHARRFVGIEVDATYFQGACQRLEATTRQGQLFAPPATQERLWQ